MTLLPDDDGLELIHTRLYETKVCHVAEDALLVRGAVSDTKPPGLYVEGLRRRQGAGAAGTGAPPLRATGSTTGARPCMRASRPSM